MPPVPYGGTRHEAMEQLRQRPERLLQEHPVLEQRAAEPVEPCAQQLAAVPRQRGHQRREQVDLGRFPVRAGAAVAEEAAVVDDVHPLRLLTGAGGARQQGEQAVLVQAVGRQPPLPEPGCVERLGGAPPGQPPPGVLARRAGGGGPAAFGQRSRT
ncbi:hypothetical protein AB0L65_57030 [Nonomuraea sp. NPDC052116]|uniref:hypothetical protein n=1 Tax=Nonomuraea sp. NPDC052116 TaxID=3155665 RepID=UPI0034159CCA